MINCIIIDDEDFAIEILEEYVKQTPFLNLIYSTTNPIDGLNFINNNNVDLVFLDLQMPQLDGMQLLSLLKNQEKVIFTTAYEKYALNAFEKGVLDYLLKPFSFERFLIAINKYQKKQEEKPTSFFINTDKKLVKINVNEVIHVEGMKNYLGITCKGKSLYISTNTFKEIEEYLTEPEFIRVNKSHIIAYSSIVSIEGNDVKISIQKPEKTQEKLIPIGNTYKKYFLSIIPKI